MNRLSTSENIHQLTHWDVILLQVKYMALDMFEERKWKKGIYHVMSNQIATKVKKSNRKKKLDELYKRCMCLYLSMNVNHNLADISMGKENKNMSEQLNTYIKSISNVDYLNKQFTHWKDVLAEIKTKLQKKFGENNLNKAKNFFKVIDLMENMINMQEETVRRINEINQREVERGMAVEKESGGVTNFLTDIEEMDYNDRLRQIDDHHYYNEYFEKKFNNLDFNSLSKELNKVIEEIVNEVNNNEEIEIFLGDSISNINDIKIPGDVIMTNADVSNLTNISNIYSSNSSLLSTKPISKSPYQELNYPNINPKQLFYDGQHITTISKHPDELKSYLEKLLKLESDKIDILPVYDYSSIAGAYIDTNAVKKDGLTSEEEYTRVFKNVFPPIYFIDNNYDKMLIESEIDTYKTKYDRVLKETEQLKLFKLKFDNFTIFQKLILLWGICTYGNNLNILSEVPNIFTFSRSLPYDGEEVFIYLDKALEQLNVDLLASNFEVANLMPVTQKKNFISQSLGYLQTSSHYIFNIDPPMLNSSQCNFYYNKKMYDYVNYKTQSINNSDIDSCIAPSVMKFRNKGDNAGSTGNFSNLNLIHYNPIFRKVEIKQFWYRGLKEDIKKICDKVEHLYIVHQNLLSGINFNTLTKDTANHISNKTGTKLSASSMPIRADVLSQLMNSKYDFSAANSSDKALDDTKPNVRQDTLEGVSFYSQQSIQKEWEILRSPWYQNNTQFKPKFRKPCKYYRD